MTDLRSTLLEIARTQQPEIECFYCHEVFVPVGDEIVACPECKKELEE